MTEAEHQELYFCQHRRLPTNKDSPSAGLSSVSTLRNGPSTNNTYSNAISKRDSSRNERTATKDSWNASIVEYVHSQAERGA